MLTAGLGTLVTYNPQAVRPDGRLPDTLRLLHQLEVHHLPVVNRELRLVGMISDADLTRAMLRFPSADGDPSGEPEWPSVREFMVSPVVSAAPEDSPRRILRLLLERGFHSVPVVDEGRLVGLVTAADYLREFVAGSWPGDQERIAAAVAPPGLRLDVDASLGEAHAAFEESGAREAVLLSGRTARAALGRRELRRLLRHAIIEAQAWGRPVSDALDRPLSPFLAEFPAPLQADATFGEAARTLWTASVQAVLVNSRDGGLAGLLGERAVLSHLLAKLTD